MYQMIFINEQNVSCVENDSPLLQSYYFISRVSDNCIIFLEVALHCFQVIEPGFLFSRHHHTLVFLSFLNLRIYQNNNVTLSLN